MIALLVANRKSVRENRMHGLMREGRRKSALYSTPFAMPLFLDAGGGAE